MSLIDLFASALEDKEGQKSRCVVRLKTTMWADKNGVNIKKRLTYLRKKCTGYNILEEDISNTSSYEVIPRIINIDECSDGIYEVVSCNEKRDWESGNIDDYDYKLIDFKE